VLAEGIDDIKTRRIVTRLADGWDTMADRAERRAAKLARYLDRNDAERSNRPAPRLRWPACQRLPTRWPS
jgi:hypothetical protein